jgi:hypothetical protein
MSDSSDEDKELKEYKRNVSYDFKDPHTRHGKKKGPVQIRFKTNFRNTLLDVCKSRPGWKHTEVCVKRGGPDKPECERLLRLHSLCRHPRGWRAFACRKSHVSTCAPFRSPHGRHRCDTR